MKVLQDSALVWTFSTEFISEQRFSDLILGWNVGNGGYLWKVIFKKEFFFWPKRFSIEKLNGNSRFDNMIQLFAQKCTEV